MGVFLVGTDWSSSLSLFFPYIPSMGRAWISVHLLKTPVQGPEFLGHGQSSTKPGCPGFSVPGGTQPGRGHHG